jgi:Ca-activated chloride channel family protein
MPERRDRDQVIVLITDGEDHDSFPEEAAKQAAERSVRIFTVGLGDSDQGARIPIRDEDGQLLYLKHQGQEVWSKVDERLLKEIALTTGGAYIPAKTRAYDLGQVYVDQTAKLTRGTVREEKRKRYREQFQLFVCLGVGLLLAEMVIPTYRRPTTELGTAQELTRGLSRFSRSRAPTEGRSGTVPFRSARGLSRSSRSESETFPLRNVDEERP